VDASSVAVRGATENEVGRATPHEISEQNYYQEEELLMFRYCPLETH